MKLNNNTHSDKKETANRPSERTEVDVNEETTVKVDEKCQFCDKICKSYRGLLQHLRACKKNNTDNEKKARTTKEDTYDEAPAQNDFKWGDVSGIEFTKKVDMIYEQIVHWKRNLFLLPSGSAGKRYLDEVSRLLDAWVDETPLRRMAMKAIHIMPALLLQKPSKTSKVKDHNEALGRRLMLWTSGDLDELLRESSHIQDNLGKASMSRADNENNRLAIAFRNKMQKGEVNNALKLLTSEESSGILPSTDATIAQLKAKHPLNVIPNEDGVLLNGPVNRLHPIAYSEIDEELIMKVAYATKGGAGPSGLDAEGWKRMLTSKQFGTASSDLRKSLANMIKKLCIIQIEDETSLQALMACRLIPLNKNPGVRPIGIGEVLRRIAGKVVMTVSKHRIVEATGSIQVCAGQEAGSEAAIHAIHDTFESSDCEAVLLVDAENAFNSINREAMLQNIDILCPIISTFIKNSYTAPSRLFVHEGKEIASKEGTTQGDPTAMAAYALALTPLMTHLLKFIEEKNLNTTEVAFADDVTAAGSLEDVKTYWDELLKVGPTFGYFPKASKSHLIVKAEKYEVAKKIFEGTNVNVTETGKRHLGAVIGSIQYKQEYLSNMVRIWNQQLECLSNIAETEPQAAYLAFTMGFKHKITYFMRTIPGISDELKKLDETVRDRFLPAVCGGHVCSDQERELLSLPTRNGGLGIPIFVNEADKEYENSRKITSELATAIKRQELTYEHSISVEVKKIKQVIRAEKRQQKGDQLKELKKKSKDEKVRLLDINTEKGVSNWLNTLPMVEYGFDLTKQQFWDAIRLRYGWNIPGLPTTCCCGEKFDLQHCMNCKKGGFISLRHNNIRDLTANMLQEVCKDVAVEPTLQQLTGEELPPTTKTGDEVRLDIKARGFWVKGQDAFFDVRVFNPNASRYLTQSLQTCYARNEREKKKAYSQRVLQVERGSFTPLVFDLQGGMARECSTFYRRLAEMMAEKRSERFSSVVGWIRTKLCFSLLRSCLVCLRGSRSTRSQKLTSIEANVRCAMIDANIRGFD